MVNGWTVREIDQQTGKTAKQIIIIELVNKSSRIGRLMIGSLAMTAIW